MFPCLVEVLLIVLGEVARALWNEVTWTVMPAME